MILFKSAIDFDLNVACLWWIPTHPYLWFFYNSQNSLFFLPEYGVGASQRGFFFLLTRKNHKNLIKKLQRCHNQNNERTHVTSPLLSQHHESQRPKVHVFLWLVSVRLYRNLGVQYTSFIQHSNCDSMFTQIKAWFLFKSELDVCSNWNLLLGGEHSKVNCVCMPIAKSHCLLF